MNFINKLRKFMQGRYGMDELSKLLFKLYIFIIIINLLFNNKLLNYLEFIIIFIIFYRVLSKKIYKRNKENKKYLQIKNKFLKPLKNIKRNYQDKHHVYKKCNKCKTTLKLPITDKRGIKHTKCPKCNHRVSILVLKKQKIEIIKK